MEKYTKVALTIDEQIGLLEGRGLDIPDTDRTARHLSNISYYRMSAYMVPFRKPNPDGSLSNDSTPGTTWNDINSLYRFDRKLRLLVFDAIERIEIALRTKLIYQLSLKYGSHWQNEASIFLPPRTNGKTGKTLDVYADIQGHIKEQLTANRKATFIKHYLSKYDDPPTPPSWMSVELLYFSELSKICQNLKSRKDRADIAKAFGLADDKTFCSWLHTLNYVRNICAHHARLWNSSLDISPVKYINKDSGKVWLSNEEVNIAQSKRLYYTLCIILYLLQSVNPNHHFREQFRLLLQKYPVVDVRYMGFPENWQEHPLWKI